MARHLNSRQRLGPGDEFAGFDLNDSRESRLLGYAKHLINTKRRESLASHFDA